MAIGKLLSPWLLRRRPHGTAARPDIHKRGKQRPYGLRYSAGPPQEAERQSQPYENRLILGCGKVAKLLFAGEPIDAVAALARRRQDARKLRQQHCKLAGERPRRVDHHQATPAQSPPPPPRRDAQI